MTSPTSSLVGLDEREVVAGVPHRAQRGVDRGLGPQRQHRPHQFAGRGRLGLRSARRARAPRPAAGPWSRTTSRRWPLARATSLIRCRRSASGGTSASSVRGRTIVAQRPGVELQRGGQLVVPFRRPARRPSRSGRAAGAGRPGCGPELTSSTGCTPTRRRHQLAIPFSATSAGRVSHMNPRIGIASSVADRSGCAIAHDLGAISPTTRCTNVTTISDSTNATTSAVASGRPQPGHHRRHHVVHRRFGDRAERQRAQRDAELRSGQQQRQFPRTAQRRPCRHAGLGGFLQPVPARGDQRELDRDEERAQRHDRRRDHQRRSTVLRPLTAATSACSCTVERHTAPGTSPVDRRGRRR